MGQDVLVIGSLNLDLVVSVARFPQSGETVGGTHFERNVGGKGANQAVAAALAGARTGMIARHGTDGFEVEILATLRRSGVDVRDVIPVEGASGVAVIVVDATGQNSIVVVPGSNGRLQAEDVRGRAERLAAAGMIMTQLETPLEVLEATLDVATRVRAPVMLDPAPGRVFGGEILRRVEWLTPNETEAALLMGSAVPTRDGLRGYAEQMLALGPANVLLKLGARGAYVATRSGMRELIAGHTVDAVDTTAAGDALNGAMAAALVQGADAVEAARFGVAAAAISVTRRGAIDSLPAREEIESFRALS